MSIITPEISIVIPAYNEAENLAACVSDTYAAAAELFATFEIIIVDDGSQDQTLQIAQSLPQAFKDKSGSIHVRHKTNGGIGSAVTYGLTHSRGRLLTYTPADNQFDFREMRHMLTQLPEHDLVVGIKKDYAIYSLKRKLLSAMNRFLLRSLFGVKVIDPNFIHLYRAEAYKKITPISQGGFFHSETLARAVAAKLKMVEVPLSLRPRHQGRSTGASAGNIIRTLTELWRFYRLMRSGNLK